MHVIIDAGHGEDTLGKRSPDGKFREWRWNREVADMLYECLRERGIDAIILVPENEDVPLKTRVERTNKLCKEWGAGDCLLVSIHSNAAGASGWNSAKGWECYTTRGVTKSDLVAEYLYAAFENAFPERRMRKDLSDGDRDKEADFYIIKHALCPAVLLENYFYDNYDECQWLLRDETKGRIARAACMGLINYINR